MKQILTYFPKLTIQQQLQFTQLGDLYRDWNSKINVISRKDIDNLYVHHILHALSIAKVVPFRPYTHILDIGTGGGLPGIPLAILFPEARFYLIDSIAKKIKVVDAIVEALGLENVQAEQKRAQQVQGKQFDFVVTRGVTKLPALYEWSKKLIVQEHYNERSNGLLALKGGDLTDEIASLPAKVQRKTKVLPISDFFEEDFFATKKVVYVKM